MWEESMLLPASIRNSFFEDILLDHCISCKDSETVASLDDGKRFVTTAISGQVIMDEDIAIMSTVSRLAIKLVYYNSSKKVPDDTRVAALLRETKKLKIQGAPLIQLVHPSEGKKTLVVTVPMYEFTDETTAKSCAAVFNFCLSIHGLGKDNLLVVTDKDLGEGKLALSKTLLNFMNSMTSSATIPLGYFAGEDVKFPTGYVGNLPCMLASMRLLNSKRDYLRKRTRLPTGVSPVAFYNLQEMFNSVSGLKSEEQKGWPLEITKAALNSCIALNNTGFPGGWVYQNRSKNHVKTDMALVQLLGWIPKSPSKEKLLEVLFNTVDEESTVGEDGKRRVTKRTIVNISKDKRPMSLPEFRTGVSLLLPYINPASSETVREQIHVDTLSVKSRQTLDSFMDNAMVEAVNILNDAYALRVSCKNPKSKTTPVHYQSARQRLLGESSKLPFVDMTGAKYESLFKIPEKTLKEFLQVFPYKVKPRKDLVETSTAQALDDPMVGSSTEAPTDSAPAKRQKMTKGQSKETLRRSGRLARRNAVLLERGAPTIVRGGGRGGLARAGPPRQPAWADASSTAAPSDRLLPDGRGVSQF
jgi:hypothetical protein